MGRSAERAIQLCAARGQPTGRARVLRRLQLVDLLGDDPSRAYGSGESRRSFLALGRDRVARSARGDCLSALLDGMQGQLERGTGTDGGRPADARGSRSPRTGSGISGLLAAQLAMLANDLELAERVLARGARRARERRRIAGYSTPPRPSSPARVHAQGRHDDAFALARRSGHAAPVDVRLRTGAAEHERSRWLPSAACDEAEASRPRSRRARPPNGLLNLRGDTLVDLAEILALAGRPEEAVSPLREAVALYERKGNVVSAAKAQTLESLADP